MVWLPPAQAATRLGIAPRTLRDRAQKDDRLRNADGLYFVDDGLDLDLRANDSNPPNPETPTTTLHDVHHDDAGGFGSNYVFDETRDRYIFSLKSKAHAGKPFVVPGETIRGMIQAYSRDGEDASINALSRTHGLHRTTVREIMRALGKTHDSAPFSDEDLAGRDESALGEDLIRLKEERVLRKAEREQWAETKRLAQEAGNLDRFVLRRIDEILKNNPQPQIPVPIAVDPAPPSNGFTCVVGLTDLHFGSAGWRDEVGQEITRAIVRERALSTTRELIARTLRFGRPARFILPAGSDNFHADTDLGTTTQGTPLDTDGSIARIFIEGCALYEELIVMLSAVAPVEVVAMPGNHDRIMSMMLTHWLAARFRESKLVSIGSAVEHRSYHLHGKSLIGFTHGDGLKDSALPLTMATEAREKWGRAKHSMILTGHLHTDRSNEYAGVRVIHMPCLATADRWHFRKTYTGNTKAIAAYLVDDDDGLVATLTVQPPAPPAPEKL